MVQLIANELMKIKKVYLFYGEHYIMGKLWHPKKEFNRKSVEFCKPEKWDCTDLKTDTVLKENNILSEELK